MQAFDVGDYTGKQTRFFSTSPPAQIMRDLMAFLQKDQAKAIRFSNETYKVNFELPGLQAKCCLLKVEQPESEQPLVCVDFTRKSGDQLSFFEWYEVAAAHLTLHSDATLQI